MQTRWAVLGPGAISRDFVVGLRASRHGVLHAVGSSSAERAAAFAAEHGAEASGTYDEILARDDVDAVYVGTVHTTHADLAIRALEAGKAVLCEKPASPTLEEVERILEAAARTQRPFLEAFKTRFGPFADALRELVAGGELGPLERVEGSVRVRRADARGPAVRPRTRGRRDPRRRVLPARAGDRPRRRGRTAASTSPDYLGFDAEIVEGVDGWATAAIAFGDVTAAIETSVVRGSLRPGDAAVRARAMSSFRMPGEAAPRARRAIIVRRGADERVIEVPVVQPMAAEADAAVARPRRGPARGAARCRGRTRVPRPAF